MGWADKAHKKNKADKMIDEIMNHPRYKEIKEKYRIEATLDAFYAFCFSGMEFLETKHRYGRNGLWGFLEFMAEKPNEMDENYYNKKIAYYKEKYDLDVLNILGCEFDNGVEM